MEKSRISRKVLGMTWVEGTVLLGRFHTKWKDQVRMDVEMRRKVLDNVEENICGGDFIPRLSTSCKDLIMMNDDDNNSMI